MIKYDPNPHRPPPIVERPYQRERRFRQQARGIIPGLCIDGISYEPYAQMFDKAREGNDAWLERINSSPAVWVVADDEDM